MHGDITEYTEQSSSEADSFSSIQEISHLYRPKDSLPRLQPKTQQNNKENLIIMSYVICDLQKMIAYYGEQSEEDGVCSMNGTDDK